MKDYEENIKEQKTLKTFRLKKTTIENLKKFTNEINKRINIKISTNGVAELLLNEGIKQGVDKIIKGIKKD